MRARSTVAAVACGLVALAGAAVPATAQDTVPTADGPGDLVVAAFSPAEDGLDLRVTRGERSWDPDDVVLRTPPDASSTVPDDPAYSFLGAAGRRTWLLSSAAGVRPAWDTKALASPVEWALAEVRGPGRFAAFTANAGAAPDVLFDSSDGTPDTHTVPAASRGRVTWAFSAPGRYHLRFTAATTVDGGDTKTTTEATYHVEVVPGALPKAPIARPVAKPAVTTTTTTTTNPPPPAEIRPEAAPQPRRELAAAATTVLAEGHADLAGRVVDGALSIAVGDESTGDHRWLDPCEVVIHARPASRLELPDDPNFAFMGAPGTPVWVLSQERQDGLLWLGWNTEDIADGALTGPVSWQLSSVEGPGAFWLFEVGALGDAAIHFNSGDGTPDTLDVPVGTHAHGNWAFQQEGVYRLRLKMSATLASGGTVQDEATLAIAVGETDPAGVVPDACNPSDPPTSSTTTTTAATTTTTTAGGNLASTGASLRPPLLGAAGLLLLVGVGLVVLTRRRDRAGR